MADETKGPVCAVAGVGPGNGEAFARRFAADGYAVALMARRAELSGKLAAELPRARAYGCDVADATSVEAAFEQIRADLGDVDVLIFNAGSGVWGTHRRRVAGGFRALLADQCAGPLSCARGRRSRRCAVVERARSSSSARPHRAAASPARRPSPRQRWRRRRSPNRWPDICGPPESMSRSSLSTAGCGRRPRRRALPAGRKTRFIAPSGVADIAAALVRQDRSAWSFEVEARPYAEKW